MDYRALYEENIRLREEIRLLEKANLSQTQETDLGRCEAVECDGFYRARVTVHLMEEYPTEEEAKRAASGYFILANRAYRDS
jgi:hypothetical protein